jgi:uncharacterized protein (DUF1330 family)
MKKEILELFAGSTQMILAKDQVRSVRNQEISGASGQMAIIRFESGHQALVFGDDPNYHGVLKLKRGDELIMAVEGIKESTNTITLASGDESKVTNKTFVNPRWLSLELSKLTADDVFGGDILAGREAAPLQHKKESAAPSQGLQPATTGVTTSGNPFGDATGA